MSYRSKLEGLLNPPVGQLNGTVRSFRMNQPDDSRLSDKRAGLSREGLLTLNPHVTQPQKKQQSFFEKKQIRSYWVYRYDVSYSYIG